ncbi:MAG: class I SAM-dependent RNA methyltransferase [Polyangiaceae bacterium]
MIASPHRLEIDATISSLAPGGDGVALVELTGERRAVFVPNSAPGDRALLSVDTSRRPARGRIRELTSPGPDRIASACPWSTRCGGCDWMHVSLDAQLRTHVDHVRAALPPTWRGTPIAAYPSHGALGYRARARVHVRCDAKGAAVVGMHEANTHEPVQVDSCAVLDPALEGARRSLGAVFQGSSGRGDVQIAFGDGRLPVYDVRWRGELARECFARLEKAVAERTIAGAQVTLAEAKRPARIGDPTPWMVGADGAPLRLSPGGFAQANEKVNRALVSHVAEVVRPWRAANAVELYSGAANMSILLAREVGELVCVESDRGACDAARANLTTRAQRARVVEADAAHYAWRPMTDLVVLDPPRTGAREVATRLAASRVAHAVYVACDAQTLGRDLAALEGSYGPTSIATFEMFPQTSHVETVVALERRRS